jgi:DNA-binding IclR family transcriptional regulator
VLSCFTVDQPRLTLTEISERVGMHKSTVHRLLGTLESRQFVQRDPGLGTYHLGLRLLEMANTVLQSNSIQDTARPHLARLVADWRETADLAVLNGSDVVYILVIESPERVKLAATAGQRLPAYCTASGKALAAHLPEDQARDIRSAGMRQRAADPHQTWGEFLAELAGIRERGYALAVGEYEEGINAVSAAVLDGNGRPVASVAIAGPAYRLTPERMCLVGPAVRGAAEAISHDLGLGAGPAAARKEPGRPGKN